MNDDEESVRLSVAGKAFMKDLSWQEHETAAWVMTQGLHGWVDRDSPVYSASFRCSVKSGPGPLWTWRVEVEHGMTRWRVRGYFHMVKGISGSWDNSETLAYGKRACLVAFRGLLQAVQT